jgi:(2Fe-2S) ferredoxin
MLNVQKIVDASNMSEIADSYIRLGRCYQQKLMFGVSLTFYEQASEIYTQMNTTEKRQIADLHWRIGRIYQDKHD